MAFRLSLEAQRESDATLPDRVMELFVARTQDWHDAEMTKREEAIHQISLKLLGEMRGALLCHDPGADDSENRKRYCEEEVRVSLPDDSVLCKIGAQEVQHMVHKHLLKLTRSKTGHDGKVKLFVDWAGDWTKDGGYTSVCGGKGLKLTLRRKL